MWIQGSSKYRLGFYLNSVSNSVFTEQMQTAASTPDDLREKSNCFSGSLICISKSFSF